MTQAAWHWQKHSSWILNELSLAGSSVGDAGCTALAEVPKANRTLHTVYFGDGHISDTDTAPLSVALDISAALHERTGRCERSHCGPSIGRSAPPPFCRLLVFLLCTVSRGLSDVGVLQLPEARS